MIMNQSNENMFFKCFVLIKTCGKGAHGTIYKIKDKVTGNMFALKEVKVDTKKEIGRIMCEDTSSYRHNNIRRYEVLFVSNRPHFLNKKKCERCFYTYIISEYYSYTLRDFLNIRNEIFWSDDKKLKIKYPSNVMKSIDFKNKEKTINVKYINMIFKGIVHGVRYLHHMKRIHRDLKPENIFINNGMCDNARIGDFGDCKIFDKNEQHSITDSVKLTCNVGTVAYGAPEICTCCYNRNIDIYSLGLIYFEMLYPFKTEMERILMFEELRTTGKVPQNFKETYYDESCIIESCIEHNPCERLSSKKILRKLFFDDLHIFKCL